MITLEQVSHSYGERWALKNISYTFENNRIYGIIGPNGAGKSTLLKVITGFEEPARGRVVIEKAILNQPQLDIAVVWQKPYLFKTTVEQNMAYGLKVRKWPKKKINERVKELLGIFRLEHLVKAQSSTLSGGEAARVAIARAIACQPKVLILDEPGANLDPVTTKLMEQTLREIQLQENLTIILVTHDMFQAKRLADVTVFLSQGSIVEAGDTSTFFKNPQCETTRKFLAGELC